MVDWESPTWGHNPPHVDPRGSWLNDDDDDGGRGEG